MRTTERNKACEQTKRVKQVTFYADNFADEMLLTMLLEGLDVGMEIGVVLDDGREKLFTYKEPIK